jgi:hypothetical protein
VYGGEDNVTDVLICYGYVVATVVAVGWWERDCGSSSARIEPERDPATAEPARSTTSGAR